MAKYQNKKQPGIILYYDKWDFYMMDLSDQELATLIRALYEYSHTGEMPVIEDRYIRMTANSMKGGIDADRLRYKEKCKKAAYSSYCRLCDKDKKEKPSFEEWELYEWSDPEEELTNVDHSRPQSAEVDGSRPNINASPNASPHVPIDGEESQKKENGKEPERGREEGEDTAIVLPSTSDGTCTPERVIKAWNEVKPENAANPESPFDLNAARRLCDRYTLEQIGLALSRVKLYPTTYKGLTFCGFCSNYENEFLQFHR